MTAPESFEVNRGEAEPPGPEPALANSDSARRNLPVAPSAFFGFFAYWGLFLGIYVGFTLIANFLEITRLPANWRFLVTEIFRFVAAVVPALLLAKGEDRSFADYGLPRRGAFGRLFWSGMLWGIAAISVLMLGLRAAGAFYFGRLTVLGLSSLEFALFWIVLFLLVALFEEFLLRGYPQFALTRGIGFWPAALVLSILFGASHWGNPGESRTGLLGAGAIGLFFCFTLRRTGNLWFAVGMHTAWNWGQSFIYAVPNSGLKAQEHLLNSSLHGPDWLAGGTVGPEASVLLFVLLSLLAVVFHFAYPDVKYRA